MDVSVYSGLAMPDIFLTNTLGREKQKFVPIHDGKVGIYSCGPTVYSRAHIGNMRSYLLSDMSRRMFEASGVAVTQVMNITDVGHLVGDGDVGEDKLEVSSKKTGESAWDIAAKYTELCLNDMRRMNMHLPHVISKATDHIAEQIAMIEALEKNGFTYIIDDGVYFDTSKLANYGRLSGQALDEKEAGSRVDVGNKRNASDFALWKFAESGVQRQMEWESPWGKGFPGWHIECSAMSAKYLGVPFDIHTGGIDMIPVHHENEIAQAEGARGVLEANYWLHNEFLQIDGGKMSKSLGNVYSLDDLAEKGISALAYRYFVLGAHYRSPLNFTWEAVQAAQNAYDRLVDTVRAWDKPTTPDEHRVGKFMERIHDDLDTPAALAILWDTVHDQAVSSSARAATILKFDEVLGLALDDVVARPIAVSPDAQKLLDDRAVARDKKDWGKSDALRDQLLAMGYRVEDSLEGQRVRDA